MLVRQILLFSATVMLAADCVPSGPPQYGRVQVEAYDFIGTPIRTFDAELSALGNRGKSEIEVRRGVAERVPYGSYKIRVGAAAFNPAEREIRVAQGDTVVRVELSLPGSCSGSAGIGGSVQPLPAGRKLWLKVVPLYGAGGTEAPVGSDGSFKIAGLDEGSYLLLVLDGTTVLHSETVSRLADNRTVNIALGRR